MFYLLTYYYYFNFRGQGVTLCMLIFILCFRILVFWEECVQYSCCLRYILLDISIVETFSCPSWQIKQPTLIKWIWGSEKVEEGRGWRRNQGRRRRERYLTTSLQSRDGNVKFNEHARDCCAISAIYQQRMKRYSLSIRVWRLIVIFHWQTISYFHKFQKTANPWFN